jgi:predicted DNA repair protein MutK
VPGSSLLALIDDIASLLDDVAAMSKVAVKKTAGVLGDDLALNAEQVTGIDATRELPVVWAVAKGSLVNKAILVPLALALSAFLPAAIVPLLMLGGLFLCYEGCEKLAHKLLTSDAADDAELAAHVAAVQDPAVDMVAFERDKIRGAVRTDFILSAEIVIITLGTLTEASFSRQVGVLVAIALAMTVGVYGLVAGIVKLDDLGHHLSRSSRAAKRQLGGYLLRIAPRLLKFLSVAGTAAMFMVGGGILTHGISAAHHWIEGLAKAAGEVPGVGLILGGTVSTLLSALAGIAAGALALAVVEGSKRAAVKVRGG